MDMHHATVPATPAQPASVYLPSNGYSRRISTRSENQTLSFRDSVLTTAKWSSTNSSTASLISITHVDARDKADVIDDKEDTDVKDEKYNEKDSSFAYAVPRRGVDQDGFATAQRLDDLLRRFPMPAFTGNKWWKRQRYHVWSVYRRLMVLVIAANFGAIVAMIVRCVRYPGTFTSAEASTAVGANLVAGILMRQEHVINTFFHIAILQPRWFPAWLRRTIAKFAFHYGGVHSSAGISAIAWYIFFLVLLPLTFPGTRTESILMVALSAIVLVLLLVIAGMSHPRVRNAHHDLWELSHRFGGWSAVAVFWIQTMFSAVVAARVADLPLGRVLIKTPSFWFLIIITWCLIYPWLWLRKVPLEAVKLSNHAAELRFTHSNIGTCRGVRLSHNPLIETHAFAGIPHCPLEGDLEKGYSVIVSNAGNWTTDMIQNPPKHIWCRGVPTLGVMRLSSLLSPIIIVATGSGIGPCTSFLNVFPHHRARILWVARDPLKTYQSGLINRVRRIDPNAVIVDSTRTGKKSVPALTYALVKETKAEGVMIISNPKATSETVEAMESRGITAFGAIFDS